MVRKNYKRQIKGDMQLEDLTDSVNFMSSKFDEHEQKRLEREARIVELEIKVVSLSTKLKSWNIQLTEWSNIQEITQY